MELILEDGLIIKNHLTDDVKKLYEKCFSYFTYKDKQLILYFNNINPKEFETIYKWVKFINCCTLVENTTNFKLFYKTIFNDFILENGNIAVKFDAIHKLYE